MWLERTPFHPSLRLLGRKGRLAGAHWVSINLSYRTTLDFVIEEDALLLNLGDHNGVH